MNQETYNIVSIIAICIGFGLTIASLWFVARQIVVNHRTRETDILLSLYEISTREPLSKDFDVAWDIHNKEILTTEQEEACLRVCLFFEMVGAVVSQRYMGTVLLEEYFGALITGIYESLRTYIDAERTKPYNNNFAVNFERLAQRIAKSPRISRAPGTHPVTENSRSSKGAPY